MACAHPFLRTDNIKNPQYGLINSYIPCGMCLNCRVDKQNQLRDRCEQELINFKCGAFVTVTYDDYNIVDKLRHDSAGKLNATLSRDDHKKFLYRLRQNVKNKLPNNLLSNHNFKFLVVGEYGGDGQIFDRPHLHYLFFGLDFAVCKKVIADSWNKQGIVEVDPILEGGISYVLKYLDKQLFGRQAQQKYDDNNLERPFQCHSVGLGKSLYENQLKYIKSTRGSYRWKGKDRPVPPYYKRKYLIPSDRFKGFENTKKDFKLEHKFKTIKSFYDLHDYKISKALIQEENTNIRLQQKGRPRYDYLCINDLHQLSQSYISELTSNALLSQVPF